MTNTITKLLEPTAVQLNLEADTSKDVINVLGELLCKAGYVQPTFINGALEREMTLPTGLELSGKVNAAIPHTDIEHVIRPALALATLAKPVMFHNMVAAEQEIPVQIVFVMALKEPHQQIEMLQEVASVLQNAEVIDALMKARSYEEVKTILEKV